MLGNPPALDSIKWQPLANARHLLLASTVLSIGRNNATGNMSSIFNALLPCALVLATLLQCAAGAPIDAPTDSPAGQPSGEEGETGSPNDTLAEALATVLGATKRHKKEFLDEFNREMKYEFLGHYAIPSLPAKCPYSNFSKEDCLRRLFEGLLIYSVLLKHVEKECPQSTIPAEVKYYSSILIREVERKMSNREQVTALTSIQEEQLLKAIDYPDTFHRKMTAHGILYNLHYFLVDCRRVIINKRERNTGSMVDGDSSAVTFYNQKNQR